jgi:type I restriction enzyme S subunit
MEVRPDYKQTEVGVIPNDWDVRPLTEVAKVTSGKRLPLGYFVRDQVTPYPYIRVTDMRPGRVDTRDIKYVPEAAYPSISKYRIFKGDLFISVAGTLGIVGSIPDELDGANLTENADRIGAITCNKDYLLHVMLSPVVQRVIESEQTVGAQPKLALKRIRAFLIPLPPTEAEQRAIATALSDVDALLGGLDRLIAKKRDLKQAAMQQLLTGQTRLPGFDDEWEVKQLGEVFQISVGTSKSAFIVEGGDYWVCDMGSVSSAGHLIVSKRTNYRGSFLAAGDLIMPKDDIGGGNIIGKVGYIDADDTYVLSDHVYHLRAKMGSPRFLAYSINSHHTNRDLRKKVIGSAQLGLGRKSVTEQEILFPPIAEQTAIAALLSDMDAELTALVARRDKTRDLKQAMMQELLTGKTRLVPPGGARA